MKKTCKSIAGISCFFILITCVVRAECATSKLQQLYELQVATPSDINEHLPMLRYLAAQCSTVVEIGVRDMVSTVAILQGLSEKPKTLRHYIGIDLNYPPSRIFEHIFRLAHNHEIHFSFIQGNDMQLDIPVTELLFIDSLHTYCHLTYELEKFASKVTKYIALHDTSNPWGSEDENIYYGDYSEYPKHIDRTKRGLWPAVEDFLANHPEWVLQERYLNCYGFTVLRRK